MTAEHQSHSGPVNLDPTQRPVALAVRYSYNPPHGGRITTMTYPNGKVLAYTYGTTGSVTDAISRVTTLTFDGTDAEWYTYLGDGTIVQRANPAVTLTYLDPAYGTSGDAGDAYTGLDRFSRVIDQQWVATAGGSVVDRYQYTYDPDSNVLSKANGLHTALSESYTYDNLNRLTGTTRNSTSYQGWTLDALGNIDTVTGHDSETRDSNSQNQVTSVGTQAIAYDNNGNVTTDDHNHHLAYDAWNRLVRVYDTDGTTLLASYAFDAAGRRITQDTGTATDLYYSGHQDIEQRQSGTVSEQTVFSLVYQNAIVLQDANAERLLFTQDANYNVTAVFNISGAVQQRMVYDADGDMAFKDAVWDVGSNTKAIGRLFQGMAYDSVICLYFTDTRAYSPTLLVWNRPDEAGYPDGLNPYQFVADNPTSRTDPAGLRLLAMVNPEAEPPSSPFPGGGGGGRSDTMIGGRGAGSFGVWDMEGNLNPAQFSSRFGPRVEPIGPGTGSPLYGSPSLSPLSGANPVGSMGSGIGGGTHYEQEFDLNPRVGTPGHAAQLPQDLQAKQKAAKERDKEGLCIVPIFKAPHSIEQGKKWAGPIGFQASDFPFDPVNDKDGKAYFALKYTVAGDYARNYGAGVLEVDIPKNDYDRKWIIYEDAFHHGAFGNFEVQLIIPNAVVAGLNQYPRKYDTAGPVGGQRMTEDV